MVTIRTIHDGITAAILAVALLLAAATITARPQKATASAPGEVPASLEITAKALMTSTAAPDSPEMPLRTR